VEAAFTTISLFWHPGVNSAVIEPKHPPPDDDELGGWPFIHTLFEQNGVSVGQLAFVKHFTHVLVLVLQKGVPGNCPQVSFEVHCTHACCSILQSGKGKLQ
jgi:hypothetical protein